MSGKGGDWSGGKSKQLLKNNKASSSRLALFSLLPVKIKQSIRKRLGSEKEEAVTKTIA